MWAKETDQKETYEFEFSPDQWLCVRNSWQGTKKFPIRFDKRTSRISWGQSYFLNVPELDSKPDRCCWYRVSDKDNAKRLPSFVWLRRSTTGASASQGKGLVVGPSADMLTPQAVVKAVARKQAVQAVQAVAKEPRKVLDRSSRFDREYFARKAVTSAASPPSPEVILDLEQIAVIYKPPYWKCELPAKGEAADDKMRGPQILLRWIRDRILDIDEKLFEEEFNPALSGTGFGPLSHRIDLETSGPLLVAKTSGAQRHLKAQFHQTSVSKQYVCLVHGKISLHSGTVDAKIRTLRTGSTSRSEVSSSGDWAQTDYEVIATFNSFFQTEAEEGFDGYSLVACRILTGRTHQIRVHMLHLGHPLVADDKYVSEAALLEDRLWCPRLFLHCYRLGFCGIKGAAELVICPLPDDLRDSLIRLGAAEIPAHASDLLFGETSWQRDLYRPAATCWRPGTRVLRRVAELIGKSGEALPLKGLHEDELLTKLLAEEGNAGNLGRAWLAKHYDIFEVLEGASSDLTVRLRAAQSTDVAATVEREVERQLEVVRSELEDLERQKQRAIAEEEYGRAGELKRRLEAVTAEYTSLRDLLADAQGDPDAAIGFAAYTEQRSSAKAKTRAKSEAFKEDVGDEELFPSLVPLIAKLVPMKVTSGTSAGDAAGFAVPVGEGARSEDAPVLSLRDALQDFLKVREGKVAHINEINNDKFMRQVMAAQQPKPIHAVNKKWIEHHEDMFAFLRTADNEIYIALCEAAQKRSTSKVASSKAGSTLAPGVAGVECPKAPAYRQVIQRASGEGDAKPLVYDYGSSSRDDKASVAAAQGSQGAVAWQESFKIVLDNSPQHSCTVEELLAAVPLFAAAIGAARAREQKEMLVMFLESFPDKFRIVKQGSGSAREYIAHAR